MVIDAGRSLMRGAIGLHQNSHRHRAPEHRRQPVVTIDDLAALSDDPPLPFLLVQIDGSAVHGWSDKCRGNRMVCRNSASARPS
jgi:hypothetical protein